MSIKSLQNYVFTAKYARYIPEKKRRETWRESCDRVMNMHLEFYKDKNIDDDIIWAFDQVKKKLVLGSQRALQYGGEPVLRKHARIYNCSFLYIDKPESFQQTMFLLLCGCGVGFSVQKHHIDKLPKLIKEKNGVEKFVIPDSIEGWADAIGVLVASYLDVPKTNQWYEYSGKNINFDYTKIREKGSPLSHGCGKAPGPEPLKKAISNIRSLLDRAMENSEFSDRKLTSIQVYDIIMHSADAVISGGHRRSATICLFSPNDELMMNAKTGNWFNENPQRGRSNNSALLVRSDTSKEEFLTLLEKTKEFGEPGFIFADNNNVGFNPCQPGWAKVLTPNGLSTIGDITVGDKIWSKEGWTQVVKKWSTGQNEVYKYTTTAGSFYGTQGHRLVSNGEKIEAKDAESIDIIAGPKIQPQNLELDYVMFGLMIGDGSVHKASNNLPILFIGQDDQDYFNSEIKDEIGAHRPGVADGAYEVKTNVNLILDELCKPVYDRTILFELFVHNCDVSYNARVTSFLRGLFSANGSVCGNRITLKSASRQLIEDTQTLLSSIGIRSYYTTNKSKSVEFGNGTYQCKESYDLNITVDRELFVNNIGFIQQYKNDKIKIVNSNRAKSTYDIISSNLVSIEETFDITVDNPSHTYWTQGCDVSNCAEISFMPYDEITGQTGVGFCNLTEINGKKVVDEESFAIACRAAAIIGTLQAGYTKFPYLGEATENITKKEALLGCSITGMMENPDILFDPKLQRKMAKLIKKVNAEIAEKIGINPAARSTCIKPAGSTSCILGSSSGIHPHHAKRYIRRVQANTIESVYDFFKKSNPQACEASVWSVNETDDVISFCIEVPPGSKTKNQISAVELLELVKLTQQNWVEYGTSPERSIDYSLRHNVSNTINVKSDEWDKVSSFIYNNRNHFAGISLLPVTGDKDYPQAPFSAIYLPHEMVSFYGDCVPFVSGLIEQAMDLFDDNLWAACDVLLGYNKAKGSAKKAWVDRCVTFSQKYNGGDVKKLTYCMKDVYNYKTWLDLNRTFVDVDYTELIEEEDNTKVQETISCAGGACEII